MSKRFTIIRDEPGSTEEVTIDSADTLEECCRKLLDWDEEYRCEVSAWDAETGRPVTVEAARKIAE